MLNKAYINVFGLFILLFSEASALKAFAQQKDSLKDQLVFIGAITNREEIWDRRTNPMMGRPDILKEIIYTVKMERLKSGAFSGDSLLKVSLKTEKLIIRNKGLWVGQAAVFYVSGKTEPYACTKLDTIPGRRGSPPKRIIPPKPDPKPTPIIDPNQPVKDSLAWLETKWKEIKTNPALHHCAERQVAKRFAMKNAQFISIVSYQGPCPPDGGYYYWGVRGLVKGKPCIWQPGYGTKLREGSELYDPKMHQK